MSQMTDLRTELDLAQADLAAHHKRYYWLKGYGTGWKGSHYGISQEEYDWAYQHNTVLRGRVLRVMQTIERHKKPGRMRPSMVRLA